MDHRAREPRRTAPPEPRSRPERSARRGGRLLVLAGLLAGVAAGALGLAERLHPSGGWISQRLAEHGVDPGLLLLAAATAFAGATLFTSLTRLGRSVEESGHRGVELFEKVGSQVMVLRKTLHEFRTEGLWMREALTGLSESVRDHIAQAEAVRKTSLQKEEGLSRVATSLDQMDARFAEHLQRADTAQTERMAQLELTLRDMVTQLSEAVGELERKVSSAPESQAQGWSTHEAYGEDPHEDAEQDPRPRGPLPEHLHELQEQLHDIGYLEPERETQGLDASSPPEGRGRESAYGQAFEESYQPAEDDLHIEVTLDQELEEPEAAAPAAEDEMDPALFETSLGLLDAFDDYGAYRPKAEEPKAPLPSPLAPRAPRARTETEQGQGPIPPGRSPRPPGA